MSFQPLGRLDPVSDLGRDAHHSPATCFKQASFVNPWPSDLSPLWPKNLSNATYRPPHHPDDAALEERLPKGKTMAGEEHPIRRADGWERELADDAGVRAVWLGHASFLVSFPTSSSRTNVLFDPVFEDRCSPMQGAGPVRDHAPPCKISELPVRSQACAPGPPFDDAAC
jgi:N-acyl-phosphatidylethanolamine-hydrolysing phospholipase D